MRRQAIVSRPGAGGFTLAETLMVLVIGAAMLGAGTLLYTEVRDNAAAAEAQEKVSMLQGMVEKYQAEYPGDLPPATLLADQWSAARPGDYDNSPWGGAARCQGSGCVTTSQGAPAGMREIAVDGTINGRNQGSATVPLAGDDGILAYVHLVPPLFTGSTTVGQDRHLATFDNNLKLWVFTADYAVAIENQIGMPFYFVRGPAYYAVGQNCGGVAPPANSPSNLCGAVGNNAPAGGSYNQ
ncbi:MAG: hypothetical protein KGR26_03085 [Cyanobacteria bacterium REEB65]|nr:hypothetical protein [Cyanobacteria bacterium REEB65]